MQLVYRQADRPINMLHIYVIYQFNYKNVYCVVVSPKFGILYSMMNLAYFTNYGLR